MINELLFKVFGTVVDKVQEMNKKDEHIQTADKSIFNDLKQKIETTKSEVSTAPFGNEDLYETLKKHINTTQVTNRENPEVETADVSVFDNLMKEIEELKSKVATQESKNTDTKHTKAQSGNVLERLEHIDKYTGAQQAMTNSMGGSLSIRLKPEISSPANHVRLPDDTLINVLEYSDHTINLDGKTSRWAHIEFNGQRGWIPESYLNFN
ncbi:MAG: hypothetical protein V3V14_00840 [Saprospiraceae bacterium]